MAISTSTPATAADARRPNGARLGRLLLIAGSLAWSLGCGPPRGTIGAVLGQQGDGRVFLREVPSELGAARAGLQEGDELLLIEGRDVRQMTEQDIQRALGGAVGDPVRLTLIRDGEVLRISVERTQARRHEVP